MKAPNSIPESASAWLPLPVAAGAVLVMFLWAICFPLISLGLANAPPLAFAALRAAVSGVALLIVAAWMRRPTIRHPSVWGSVILIGLSATSLGFFGMFYGGGRVAPGLATVIANTQPLMAAAFAWVYLDERLRRIQRWGLVAGFAGIVLIGAPSVSGSDTQSLGLIYILIGAVGVAISNVALKRLAGHVDSLWAMGWQLVIGSVPLALAACFTEDLRTIAWTPIFTINLLTLSLVGTSAAFALWFSLLQRASLNQLNIFTFLTPIFGLLIGILLFAETLHGIEWVGIGLSLAGICAMSRSEVDAVVAEQCPRFD